MRECAGSIPYSPVRVAAGACVVVIWMSSSVVVDMSSIPGRRKKYSGGGRRAPQRQPRLRDQSRAQTGSADGTTVRRGLDLDVPAGCVGVWTDQVSRFDNLHGLLGVCYLRKGHIELDGDLEPSF